MFSARAAASSCSVRSALSHSWTSCEVVIESTPEVRTHRTASTHLIRTLEGVVEVLWPDAGLVCHLGQDGLGHGSNPPLLRCQRLDDRLHQRCRGVNLTLLDERNHLLDCDLALQGQRGSKCVESQGQRQCEATTELLASRKALVLPLLIGGGTSRRSQASSSL